jgi:hypothetical protein
MSYLMTIYFIYAKMAITNHDADDNVANHPAKAGKLNPSFLARPP